MFSCEFCLRFLSILDGLWPSCVECGSRGPSWEREKNTANDPEKLPKYGTHPDPGLVKGRVSDNFLPLSASLTHPPQFHDSEMLG